MIITKKDVQFKTPDEIADIVQFFENPDSPLPFPGKVYLDEHDELHVFLQKDTSPDGEAYVVGFSLGFDPRARWIHVYILLIASWLFYPTEYKMRPFHEWNTFIEGYRYGKRKITEGLSWNDIYASVPCSITEVEMAYS